MAVPKTGRGLVFWAVKVDGRGRLEQDGDVSEIEPSTLYLVATPIGNLGDLSKRACAVLEGVDLIVCEDTRHSRTLLSAYGIRTPTASLPAFDEKGRVPPLVERLRAGASLALISDAGSPGISDPGESLVVACIDAGLRVVPVPGASALIAALSASGLPTARFHFLGFLPRGASDAQSMLEEVAPLSATLVFYESPRRVVETLELLAKTLGDRRACLAREVTKKHETFLRGTLTEMLAALKGIEVLGEVVVLVEGRMKAARWSEEEVRTAVEAGLLRGDRLSALASDIALASGWSRQDVYKQGLGLKRTRKDENL